VGRLAETFNQMRVSLQATQQALIQRERLSAIGQTVGSIVHDLRNPLTVIRLGVELLRKDPGVVAQYPRVLQDLLNACNRMATMVQELLEFSRGETPLETSPVPVGQIVEEALGILQPRRVDHVPVEVCGDMSLKVLADQERISRVVVNLIRNAVEAMEGKGKVELRARATGPMVQLEVADNGPGIPFAVRERIFEPFVTAGKKGGTGLGLTIVKKVVEDHKGRIFFHTESGVGTRFVVELPAA